jgi:hypothetical protein
MKYLPLCAPTIFMISQYGYHLNLKHVTLQFVTTQSRQKKFLVYIINEHCKLLRAMQNNYAQRTTHKNLLW